MPDLYRDNWLHACASIEDDDPEPSAVPVEDAQSATGLDRRMRIEVQSDRMRIAITALLG
jgi:hypothetical protein